MALCFTGGAILRTCKPILFHPNLLGSSPFILQVRHAKRKGYREKMRKNKKLQKIQEAPSKEIVKLRQKFTKIEKTVDPKKPDPPDDDIFIENDFKPKKYSLLEAINFHKEYHHPTVFNNPFAPIFVRIEFNMVGKKKTKFLKAFRGIAPIPHALSSVVKRDVLVFCKPDKVQEALECGATMAGGLDIIKKIQEGLIQLPSYEYVICQAEFFPELTPIRNLLKTQMPRLKSGTLTNNLIPAIKKFLYGIEYTCVKLPTMDDFGIIDCQIGSIDMETSAIDENFRTLITEVNYFRPEREGDFITYIWCRSPPSPEKFSIDVSLYEDNNIKHSTENLEEEETENKNVEISTKS